MSVDLTKGIVRILKADGTTAGTGFVVSSDGLIATCSHVVQSEESQQRGDPRPDHVELVFHVTGDHRRATVEPECWRSHNSEDTAILRVEGQLPHRVVPVAMGASQKTFGHRFKTFGFPLTNDVEGIWGYGTIGDVTTVASHNVLQLTGATEITTGFSGAPVWDEKMNCAVGMVDSITAPDQHQRLAETAFIIPNETLSSVCPSVRLSHAYYYRNSLVRSLAALMIVVVVILVTYLISRVRSPGHMVGDFRIAVAGFEENGHSGNSQVGTDLAQGVYLRLEQTLRNTDEGFSITVWGPDKVGVVRGQSRDDRATFAERVAKTVGADIVVYGIVDTTETTWQVSPEFYVSSENFHEAEEVIGQHELGMPIPLTGYGSIADRIKISDRLMSRVQALARLVVGLAHYAEQDFERALTAFQSAERITGWKDNEGKQVLYLLAGNAAGKSNQLDLAEAYYGKSLELDPKYARALVGIATVYYRRALVPFEGSKKPADTDVALLNRSIETYEEALRADHQPALSDVPTKVHFGLGNCYFALVYSGNAKSFDPAVAEFRAVINEYADGNNPRVRFLAAESHARLGLVYDLSGYTTWSIEEYQSAAELLSDNPERQAQYKRRAVELENR